jgi:hypothetical protein
VVSYLSYYFIHILGEFVPHPLPRFLCFPLSISEFLRYASLGMFADYVGYQWTTGEKMTEKEAWKIARAFLNEMDLLNKAHVLEALSDTSSDSSDAGEPDAEALSDTSDSSGPGGPPDAELKLD